MILLNYHLTDRHGIWECSTVKTCLGFKSPFHSVKYRAFSTITPILFLIPK